MKRERKEGAMSGVCSSQRGESLLPPTGAGATISTNGGKPFTPATNHRTLQLCFHKPARKNVGSLVHNSVFSQSSAPTVMYTMYIVLSSTSYQSCSLPAPSQSGTKNDQAFTAVKPSCCREPRNFHPSWATMPTDMSLYIL